MEVKAKKRHKWILPVVICVLLSATVVLAILNKNEVQKTLASFGVDEIRISANGSEIARLSLDQIKDMPKVTIDEGLRTSTGDEDVAFGGVLLKDVFEKIEFSADTYQFLTYKAIDGFTSAGTIDEVIDGNVYLIYERDGKQTKSKQQGGTGPMEIVIIGEQFSMRNCKFLMEIICE